MKKILVTGSSGFIGMHLCLELLSRRYLVHGIDSMNNYYDVDLKKARLKKLLNRKNFSFSKINIENYDDLKSIFEKFRPNKVVNLAAQAGVRYSIENPSAYINSNVNGFMNILESCRHFKVENLVYASSSSVYGSNKDIPFSVKDRTDNPISIYATSKKSNELMAKSYSHLFNLKTTGLRFFTVYGPWGRPDMAMYIFADKISKNEPIQVFNNGIMKRDFTYIGDIVQGVVSSVEASFECEIFNLGNNRSENLKDMIRLIEKSLGKKAIIDFKGMQLGDVKDTFADIDYSIKKLNYNPKTSIRKGIPKFIDWFLSYKKNYS